MSTPETGRLLAIAVLCALLVTGCQHIPWDRIPDLISHPDPAPIEEPVPAPDSAADPFTYPEVAAHLPWDGRWFIDLQGVFTRNGRIIRTNEIRTGLDLFWWHNHQLNLRLYDGDTRGRIRFTQTNVGSDYAIRRPGVDPVTGSDHWAASLPATALRESTSHLRIEYRGPERSVQIYVNGILILDFAFEIYKLPPPAHRVKLLGFKGRVETGVLSQ